ncbi:MAG: hypothetical protein DRN05_00555 [Thermoplasmata archaeon]|nr:MAG: hypothetical protein DRN05_00555 [Thermoplasmata archaeon]
MDRYRRYKETGEDERIVFVSDKREHYRNVFDKFFSRTCKLTHGVPIACKRYGFEYNTNPVERYNEDIK